MSDRDEASNKGLANTKAPDLSGVEARRLRGALLSRLFGRDTAAVRIGPYTVERKVGQGGMGAVYLAHDDDGREVAVKTVLDPSHEARTRLRREASALAMLEHPNIVRVVGCDDFDDGVYVAMEYLDGGTLRRWSEAQARSVEETVAMYEPVGRALARTHAAGLIHRDFKPDNVIVDQEGVPRLLDFGLARALRGGEATHAELLAQTLTKTGAQLGTPGYTPPEMLLGDDVDARGDQFSYCVAVYEALCHRLPFSGATADALELAAVRGAVEPFPPEIPAPIPDVLRRGLSPRPVDRFGDMNALLDALRTPPS